MDYADFLASKQLVVRPSGITVDDADIHPSLFPFQRDLTPVSYTHLTLPTNREV